MPAKPWRDRGLVEDISGPRNGRLRPAGGEGFVAGEHHDVHLMKGLNIVKTIKLPNAKLETGATNAKDYAAAISAMCFLRNST